MATSRSLIDTTSADRVGSGEVGTDRVRTFFERIAIVELNTPALFVIFAWTIPVVISPSVSTFFLAVASCISLSFTAPESKRWFQVVWKR
jgi:hypothetical protein